MPTMAFVVKTKRGRFEVRESRSTEAGPRARTLASFTELTDEVVEKAQARAEKTLDAGALREAATRAGAPVAGTPVDEAARRTLRLLARGEHEIDPMLKRLLLDALEHDEPSMRGALEGPSPAPSHDPVSDAARSASEWIGADLAERGRALRDLLELGDALPLRRRPDAIGFPRLASVRR